MDTTVFHVEFDSNVRELMDPVRDTLIESTESCTKKEIIGQLLMNVLREDMDADYKSFLVRVADHMGPDWAQALYRAAVFITKVA